MLYNSQLSCQTSNDDECAAAKQLYWRPDEAGMDEGGMASRGGGHGTIGGVGHSYHCETRSLLDMTDHIYVRPAYYGGIAVLLSCVYLRSRWAMPITQKVS